MSKQVFKPYYCKMIEKVTRGTADVYHCYVYKIEGDEFFTIGQGPEKESRISKYEFNKEEWIVEKCDKADVQHYFKSALLKRQKLVMDAEFEIEHQRFLLNEETKFYNEVMK